MQNKTKFEPCEALLTIFDGQTDVITASGNAHDAPEAWFGEGNSNNGLLGGDGQ